jgi:hypothetical protein
MVLPGNPNKGKVAGGGCMALEEPLQFVSTDHEGSTALRPILVQMATRVMQPPAPIGGRLIPLCDRSIRPIGSSKIIGQPNFHGRV